MRDEERQLRRERARKRTRRQRLGLAALTALALAAAAAGSVLALGGGGESEANPSPAQATVAAAAERHPAAELPGGGTAIFPRYRVVAFYGAPQDDALGALGIGSPAAAARRLADQAQGYRSGGRPILPAFELLAAIASSGAGADGLYRIRQDPAVIRRYLRAARRAGALLVLDIQPGRADFLAEVKVLRRWLEQPDVGLALDPEWHMGPNEVPGETIGSTDAATVNEVSEYLAEIVRRKGLPEKLLLVHQFTDSMVERKRALRPRAGVALVLNVDGFGTQAAKISKYRALAPRRHGIGSGIKLFYEEDVDLLRPREVLRLRPQPDVVVYE